MPTDENKKPEIPVPILETDKPESLSDTQLFLIGQISEAKDIANEAHSHTESTLTIVKSLSEEINSRDKTIKHEFDLLRQSIVANNDRSNKAFDSLTDELKSLNVNLQRATLSVAKLESVKDSHNELRELVHGQSERMTAHIEIQSRNDGIVDTKIQNLTKNTAKDYSELRTSIQSVSDDIKTMMGEVSPSIDQTKFLSALWKGLVSLAAIVVMIVALWTAFSSYLDKRDRDRPGYPLEMRAPSNKPKTNTIKKP